MTQVAQNVWPQGSMKGARDSVLHACCPCTPSGPAVAEAPSLRGAFALSATSTLYRSGRDMVPRRSGVLARSSLAANRFVEENGKELTLYADPEGYQLHAEAQN